MPTPMIEATFNNTIDTIHPAYVDVAGNEIKVSAISLRKTLEHCEKDTSVLCDGFSWFHGDLCYITNVREDCR